MALALHAAKRLLFSVAARECDILTVLQENGLRVDDNFIQNLIDSFALSSTNLDIPVHGSFFAAAAGWPGIEKFVAQQIELQIAELRRQSAVHGSYGGHGFSTSIRALSESVAGDITRQLKAEDDKQGLYMSCIVHVRVVITERVTGRTHLISSCLLLLFFFCQVC